MVAEIMSKKPRSTENIFDFADSLASALTGRTMIRPIQTITPIAIILVIIWTLCMSVAIILRKSDPDSVALKFTSSSEIIPELGAQFLKSLILPLKLQSAQHDDARRKRNMRMRQKIFIYYNRILMMKFTRK